MKTRDFSILLKILENVIQNYGVGVTKICGLVPRQEYISSVTRFVYKVGLSGKDADVAKHLLIRMCKLQGTGDRIPEHIFVMICDAVTREIRSRMSKGMEELTLLRRRLEISSETRVGAVFINAIFEIAEEVGDGTVDPLMRQVLKGFHRTALVDGS